VAAPKKYPDELRARALHLYRESDPKPVVARCTRRPADPAQRQGSNYTSFRFAERLQDNGILLSMGSDPIGDAGQPLGLAP
jgi:hypothetical protein